MKKAKKIMTLIVALSILLTTQVTTNAFATDTIAKPTSVDVNFSSKDHLNLLLKSDWNSEIGILRQKAIKQNKVIDMDKYEQALQNAKTPQQKQELSKAMEDYVIEKNIVYLSKSNEPINSNQNYTASLGDVRMVYEISYAATTTYAQLSGQTLNNLIYSSLSIAVGWAHSATGTFMSILGMYIPPYDFETYSGVLERTLYDYTIRTKKAEVYQTDGYNYYWAPMATTEKRETYAQLNTVYHDINGYRQEPDNLDVGEVKEQYGEYYLDEDRLMQLAQNTTSPLFYSYTTGPSYNYNNDYLLKY